MPILLNGVPVNLTSGSQEAGPVLVPDDVHRVTLRLKRMTATTPTFWTNPATRVEGEIFVSYDGGATFELACGFVSSGGVHVKRDGTVAAETTVTRELQQQPGRQAKARITVVSDGPLVTEATLEIN